MRTVLAVTLMNLRAIRGRLGSSLVIVVGIALVVGVFIGMLSMSQGFERTLAGTGRPDRALLLSAGVIAELSSGIAPDVVALAQSLPGVVRGADGRPLASAETVVITELGKGTGRNRASVNVALRGVEPAGIALRREVRLAGGRWFRSGLREIVAGRQAQAKFEGIALGNTLHFRGSDWTVVGVLQSGGDAHESELWTDADTARSAFGRLGASSLLLQLETADDVARVRDAVTTDPRFQLDVHAEPDYFAAQSETLTRTIRLVTLVVAVIMAFGAVFGALNTMFSAVSARQVEIATLRAIGFPGTPIVVSVLVEALALALLGGVAGAVASYFLFNGLTGSTLGQNFTQVAFSFMVTPALVGQALTWALVIGLIGGIFPAVRAARLPIVDALRAQ